MTIEYQIHLPDYIAKCINKDQPKLHCNGQCMLMKKIKEKEKEETRKNMLVYEYSSLYVQPTNNTIIQCFQNDESSVINFSPYLSEYSFNYNISIFRPPIA